MPSSNTPYQVYAVKQIVDCIHQNGCIWRTTGSGNLSLLSNWFLYHLLQKMETVFERIATGGTIKALCVSAPSLPEQQRIADCLNSLDDLITSHTQELEVLKTHKPTRKG